MSFDLIRRVETLGRPRVLVVGDLILDRYLWGAAERISQEAAVPLLRAEEREHRLGGAAGVAWMLRALGADVQVMGVIGRDPEAVLVRRLLAEQMIDDSLVVAVDDRATTLRERFIGRAQGRHPQQMLRVDHEVRAPLSDAVEAMLLAPVTEAVADAELVLIADHDLGVCTPRLLRTLIAAARSLGPRVVADPLRASDYSKYHWLHALIPNRLDARRVTGMAIDRPGDALSAARRLVEMLDLEAALVTLDRDGMALAQADGRAALVPTRPREVYDSTGASEIVLAVVGLCLASGADYDEAAALANVAGGLEVEKLGSVPLSRHELIRALIGRHRPGSSKRLDGPALVEEVRRHRDAGDRIVLAIGDFDPRQVEDVRRLREASDQGDYLIVGASAAGDRAELLAALECLDAVTLLDGETAPDLIETLLPDVLVVDDAGEAIGREEVEASGGLVMVLPRVGKMEEYSAPDGRTLIAHAAEALPPTPAARPARNAKKSKS